jgi:hypothetical protein
VTDALPEDVEAGIVVRERLRILMIGFYIRGGMMAVFGFFFLIYVAMFAGISFIPESAWSQPSPAANASPTPSLSVTPSAHQNSGAPPVIMFRIMAGIFSVVTFLIWVVGGLTAYAGRCIQKRRHQLLIHIMAALNCLFIPYGTLLGIFTFIILGSPAAGREFGEATAN